MASVVVSGAGRMSALMTMGCAFFTFVSIASGKLIFTGAMLLMSDSCSAVTSVSLRPITLISMVSSAFFGVGSTLLGVLAVNVRVQRCGARWLNVVNWLLLIVKTTLAVRV